MSKIAVVYWSGTGNTEAMAKAVLEGAKEKGAEVVLLTPDEFDVSMMDSYDAIAFGCPAMGAEVLEEEEFEPMFASCESKLSGKKNCTVWLLWLGRWRVDERLGDKMQRGGSCLDL